MKSSRFLRTDALRLIFCLPPTRLHHVIILHRQTRDRASRGSFQIGKSTEWREKCSVVIIGVFETTSISFNYCLSLIVKVPLEDSAEIMEPSIGLPLALLLLLTSIFLVQSRMLLDSTLGLSEIDWHLEKEHIYLGSPSIVRCQDHLVASHDYFGSGQHFGKPTDYKVSVFGSWDEGVTWKFLANVTEMYWANLFIHNDHLYVMGTASDGHGVGHNISDISIARSDDGGKTWTTASHVVRGPYHTAPTPSLVMTLNGKSTILRAMEYWKPPGTYGSDFYAVMAIGDATCDDLTVPSCWTLSKTLAFNESWIPKEWGKLVAPSWQEGNAVETPDGQGVVNILRFNGPPEVNKAVMVTFDPATKSLSFKQFINFPGGHTKFTIRRHPQTKIYWTLSNNVTDAQYGGMRNILTLANSEDLVTWNVCKERLLQDDTGFDFADSVRFTGFHYVDWHFDGTNNDTIIYAIRTGYRGANTFHNANRLTYKSLESFDKFCSQSSPLL